jgi:hypothetical protein
MENIYSVVITAITVLGGSTAFRYYEKRAAKKDEDENFMRNDCRTRIAKLEALLERASEEKDILRAQILSLTESVAKLQTQIEFLSNGKSKGI